MRRTFMGIELGATNIKAVLIDTDHHMVAQASYAWDNRLENGVWTYPMEAVWAGLRDVVEACFASLPEAVVIEGLGISGMMHGYLPFDSDGRLLTPYRTWRNTFTGKASQELTALFGCNVPRRWSISHLYHAVYFKEEHVKDIHHINTLAGYVHHRISGEFAVGIGEASGMFPINGDDYDGKYIRQFEELTAEYGLQWKLKNMLPSVRRAGEYAGVLSEQGARLLDPTGRLKPGTPLAPPEGDGGTGMVCTNSIAPFTGNVSAGASIISMTVINKPLSRAYPEIDIVATPTGRPVALVQCNNGMADLSAWADTYREFCAVMGMRTDNDTLVQTLCRESLRGDPDCGGVTVIGYLSGEHVTDFDSGCPLILRDPAVRFTLRNFLRAQMYAALASLAIGMRILSRENLPISRLTAHGSFFETGDAGQQILADAVNAPVAVMQTAAEGGAYGMALLVAYCMQKEGLESLDQYLDTRVFQHVRRCVVLPNEEGVQGFQTYLRRFERALPVERAAVGGNVFADQSDEMRR